MRLNKSLLSEIADYRANTHINASTVSNGAALWLRLVLASMMALSSELLRVDLHATVLGKGCS
jgi:hypothetical protein